MGAEGALTGEQQELLQLLRAIASRDRAAVSRLLAASPALARIALTTGASRQSEGDYFLEDIAHHVYAGDTALHVAAAGYECDIAKELLAKAADVRARNRRGAEPLHYAADGNPTSAQWDPEAQHDVIAFLIAAGADPNAQTKDGVTPLHRAVRTRCTGAVRALLGNGADVSRKNKSGSTPMDLAALDTGRGGTGSAASRKEQAEIIRLLRIHGA